MIKLNYKEINTLYACLSTDNIKYTLNGIYFDFIEQEDQVNDVKLDMLYIVAIDGRRLFYSGIAIADKDDLALSKKLHNKIYNIPRKAKKNEEVWIFEENNNIVFRYYDTKKKKSEQQLPTIISGKYPNWRLFIQRPDDVEYTMVINGNLFKDLPIEKPCKLLLNRNKQCRLMFRDEEYIDNKNYMVFMPCKIDDDDIIKNKYEKLIEENEELKKDIERLKKEKPMEVKEKMSVVEGILTDAPLRQIMPGEFEKVFFTVKTVDTKGVEKIFKVIARDKLAENCEKFLDKDKRVIITGSLNDKSIIESKEIKFLSSVKEKEEIVHKVEVNNDDLYDF